MTDREIQDVDSLSGIDAVGDRTVDGDNFDALLAQAKEANRLRDELTQAQQIVTLLGNQLAAQHPVIEAVGRWYETPVNAGLVPAFEAYRAWLASHPHVDYAGKVTVEVDGTVKS